MSQRLDAPIADMELLARFVLFENRVRADGTVKADAFMPPPSLELSVTRHLATTPAELWDRGQAVASASGRKLVGRADLLAGAVRTGRPLDAVPAALPEDPGHAHVVGWPPLSEKAAQKELAMRLAAAAVFVRPPADSR